MGSLTHKDLIKFLEQFDEYKKRNIKILETVRNDFENITYEEVDMCVFLVATLLNKPAHGNMYNLFQHYFLNANDRKEIHELVRYPVHPDKTQTNYTVIGDDNRVQQGYENIIIENSMLELGYLKQLLEEKEKSLQDKERTIQILLNQNK